MIDIEDLILKANTLLERLPAREVSGATAQAYQVTFQRMWNSKSLDPLQDKIALDTYYHRRASLHFGARLFLIGARDECLAAVARAENALAQRWARKLLDAVECLEPILRLEPPVPEGILPWQRPPSRWHQSPNSDRARGQNSKDAVLLRFLPADWDRRIWDEAENKRDFVHLDAIAVEMVAPLRPEELVPGERPIGWSPGVLIELRSARCLAITFAPVKSHNGLYGTGLTEISVDPIAFGGAARYLAARCRASGGRMVVSTRSKNAVRKALAKLGSKALPELGEVVITPYVLRHQIIADMKKTFGGGEDVAAAAGHGTDRTQGHYADSKHGRTRKGFISIKAVRRPRCGNVERARRLSSRKGLREEN